MSLHTFLKLNESDQRDLLSRTHKVMPISLQSIEKDIFVCLFLDKVMSLPELGQHITFKGGTSLSKAHRITERFSEDVDLVVDRTALGLSDDGIPGPDHSPRQQKERAKKIAKACYAWASTKLVPALTQALAEELRHDRWSVRVAPPSDNHETVIHFDYPKLFGTGSGYLLPVIKVDLVAKADTWPNTLMPVRAYTHEQFAAEIGSGEFMVRTLVAERTLLEKALLLHEVLIQRPEGPRHRLARHYYDLYFLLRAGISEQALAQQDLYSAIVQQRSIYYRYPGVDYSALLSEGFSIIPQGAARDAWQQDYEGMSRDMFYGEFPAFADVLSALHEFETTFRSHLRSTLTSTRR